MILNILTKTANKIRDIFKKYPVWYIILGYVTTFYTLFFAGMIWYYSVIPNYINDYVDYTKYEFIIIYTSLFLIVELICAIYSWIEVYKFFKNKK